MPRGHPSETGYPPAGPPRMPTPPPAMDPNDHAYHYGHAPAASGYDAPGYQPYPPQHGMENPFSGGGGHDQDGYGGPGGTTSRRASEEYYQQQHHRRRSSQLAPYGQQPDNMAFPSAQSLPGYGGPNDTMDQAAGGDVPLVAAGAQGGYTPVQGYEDEFGHDDPDGQANNRLMPRGRMLSDNGYMPGGFVDPNSMEEGELPPGIRYGRIPQRVPRRYKTLKRVELYHGNLVLDCPVPSKLLEKLNDRESREFTHMRYTAATCDPDNFKDEHYTLRQVLFDPPRRTELFIVATMYNEDEELFTRTMHGIMTNIAHLCTRERSKTWGREGWKKAVVCIVSDGRLKINSRTLSVLAAMGVYQEGVAKNVVNGKPVTAHIYEYTTQLSVDSQLRFRGREKGIMPVQILFCLKERNQKKINSHRWFFSAFGPILQPNVCILLDVGTMPRSKSLYHLWKAFDINSNVAGACGEIVALKGRFWEGLLNPLVGAQNFEYKMSNILDKPLESVFGYISVLPGAFSAYRYIALQNDSTGAGPLHQYFKGETLHGGQSDADIFTSNMYLAEDRILCWELCSKRDSRWVLHYVKSAQAVTDVPDSVPELISQRRRWLNGSFFAGVHSIVKFYYIYRSSHSFGRKFVLHLELLYQLISLIFSWFALANYFIAFYVLTKATSEVIPQLTIPNYILCYVYLAFLIFCFLLSLGNRPAGSKWGYITAMVMFALLTVYMTAAAVGLAIMSIIRAEKDGSSATSLIGNDVFRNIVISIASTFGIWLLASILYLEPWHMLTSIVQYMLLAPSFINVINVYAFANTHDVSWGTKGSDKVSTDLGVVGSSGGKNQVDVAIPTDNKDINDAYDDACHVLMTKKPKEIKTVDTEMKQKDYYATVRTNVLLVWSLSNAGLAIGILNVTNTRVQIVYMGFLLYSVAALALIKFLGTCIYLTKRLFAGE